MNIVTNKSTARHRGVWKLEMELEHLPANPFFEVEFDLAFTLPDGSEIVAEGFFKGGSSWSARAYCSQTGSWMWRSQSNLPSLDGRTGTFEVAPSPLPGKLRIHPDDPRHFAYDNGEWFLHIGDTAYRYVAAAELHWQQYIDEAAEVGFNKIRTWFSSGRHDISALFTEDRQGLNLDYWDEIDRRLSYALEHHPHIQFQVIPYGEDWPELWRYAEGDRASLLVARYAQARFSAFPNVQWCISNDSIITAEPGRRNIDPAIIDRIAQDMRSREPWNTLLTNHQARFHGYSFNTAEWSDMTTLEDLDQVAGALILQYRAWSTGPVVLDEDRYGIYRAPRHHRYFFRRLMWASLLSGGHPTYGGLNTFIPSDGDDPLNGIHGYQTAVRKGLLEDGAADFHHIRSFFAETGLCLPGLQPMDAMGGNNGLQTKVMTGNKTILAYLQNPNSNTPETADMAESIATCRLHLPQGTWQIRWFHPRDGQWHADSEHQEVKGASTREFSSPFTGDAILLLTEP